MIRFLRDLVFVSLIASLLPGCVIDHAFDCVNGRGHPIIEEYDLNDFSELRLSMNADVFISQSDHHKIGIKAQPNIIDHLDFRVRNRVLTIGSDYCIRDHNPIEIYLEMKEIESINNTGSGYVISEHQLIVDEIDINISGSGDIVLDLDALQINSRISGSGDLRLSGVAGKLYHTVSGSGNLEAFGLPVVEAYLDVSGSGDSELNVSDYLDVRISGSGNVFFTGSPEINSRISGSGRIIQAH